MVAGARHVHARAPGGLPVLGLAESADQAGPETCRRLGLADGAREAGLIGLTRVVAHDLARSGVRCNAVSPFAALRSRYARASAK